VSAITLSIVPATPQKVSIRGRVLVWFSCGIASTVAAKLAIEKYGDDVELLYCNTLANEHPDNVRFIREVERWLGRHILILSRNEYRDIYEVFYKTGWLIGPHGARCTEELKRNVRRAYQRPDDLHIFGLTADEGKRIARFEKENPDLDVEWNLREAGMTKRACHLAVSKAGIRQPMMYDLGYRNNNCIGCVKGGMGYWNKIRRDFPDVFERMAKQERKMNAAICHKEGPKRKRIRVFLDELPPTAGNYKTEKDISCGAQCYGIQKQLLPAMEASA